MPWSLEKVQRVAKLSFWIVTAEFLGLSAWAAKRLFGDTPTPDDAKLFCIGIIGIPIFFLAYRVIVVSAEELAKHNY